MSIIKRSRPRQPTAATAAPPAKRPRAPAIRLPAAIVLEILSLCSGLKLREKLERLDDEARSALAVRHRRCPRYIHVCASVDRSLLRFADASVPGVLLLLARAEQQALALARLDALAVIPASALAPADLARLPAWHDATSKDDARLRHAIQHAVARLLLRARPFGSELWLRQFPAMVPRLELRLYCSALSRSAYADMRTLLPRLAAIHRSLCGRLGADAEQAELEGASTAAPPATGALRDALKVNVVVAPALR